VIAGLERLGTLGISIIAQQLLVQLGPPLQRGLRLLLALAEDAPPSSASKTPLSSTSAGILPNHLGVPDWHGPDQMGVLWAPLRHWPLHSLSIPNPSHFSTILIALRPSRSTLHMVGCGSKGRKYSVHAVALLILAVRALALNLLDPFPVQSAASAHIHPGFPRPVINSYSLLPTRQ